MAASFRKSIAPTSTLITLRPVRFALIGGNQVNVVIFYDLVRVVAYEKLALANDDCCYEKYVYDYYLANAQFADCESIDCTQGNDDKQVGHLADGNLLCAVSYDAEHCKKTKCNAGLELYVAKYVDEHEGTYCN